MSSFYRITKHPKTGVFEEAIWMDRPGKREYLVSFFSDNSTYPEDQIKGWQEDYGIK